MDIYYDPSAFLDAWKSGVKQAGPQWFGEGEDPSTAETKWELPPRVAHIDAHIAGMSRSEAVFLGAMVSFYNDKIGSPWLQDAIGSSDFGMADIAASLDAPRRRVIADLLLSYCGW